MQYSTNFVIYAARSGQYRKAYILFLRSCLPWLFKSKSGIKPIFIINPIIKRCGSTPDLLKYKNPRISKFEEKNNFSLDLRFEKILCTSHRNNLKDTSTIVLIQLKTCEIQKRISSTNRQYMSDEHYPVCEILNQSKRRTMSI